MTRPAPAPGSWPSPLTPALVVAGARGVTELQVDGDAVCWLELRPDEGGRTALVRRAPDGTVTDLTPAGADVRTRVHEYGGGSYRVVGGVAYYVEHADQRIHRLDPGGEPRPITPEPVRDAGLRWAEFVPTPDGRHLVCVQETHLGDDATEVTNALVAVPVDGGEPVVLATGRDFYASPRLSPDGRRLAYVTWDHPDMPWDASEVVLAELDGLTVTAQRTVAGGRDPAPTSAFLPAFGPDGALHLVSEAAGWWNLHRLDETTGALENLAEVAVELGQPAWSLGQSLHGFLPDGRVAVVATDAAAERPSVLDPATGTLTPLTDHTVCRHLVVDGDAVWFIGASPTAFPEVVRAVPATGAVEVVHRTRALPVDAAWLPQPEAIAFPTGDGATAHAFLYPPTNPDVDAATTGRPPLVVTSHGGPTAHAPPHLSLSTAYWTSRGFAVVDVNYRGSSGFGRAYRDALRGRWGIADVEDCAAAAAFLAERGDVDGDRLVIRGGSASGYTTLCALAFTDTFAAGASHYGVADLALLAQHTHKFESRYLDGLIGPYPEAREVYEARSPLHHAEGITCPVILFQGLEDRVVPPEQAEAMAGALAARGIPHAHLTFPGEQHGFRDAATIVRCLEAELSFYTQVLDLPHPAGLDPVALTGAR